MTTVEIHQQELFDLLLCAVRYSLGRQTYMPFRVQELVLKYATRLKREHVTKLNTEVKRDLDRHEALGLAAGSASDHEGWREFCHRLEAIEGSWS